MPTLTASSHRAELRSAASLPERPIRIDISEATRLELAGLFTSEGRCCEPDHLDRLRALIAGGRVDAGLAVLVAAVERHGPVYVRID